MYVCTDFFLKKTNGLYIQENKYNSIQNFERLLV